MSILPSFFFRPTYFIPIFIGEGSTGLHGTFVSRLEHVHASLNKNSSHQLHRVHNDHHSHSSFLQILLLLFSREKLGERERGRKKLELSFIHFLPSSFLFCFPPVSLPSFQIWCIITYRHNLKQHTISCWTSCRFRSSFFYSIWR